MPCGGIEPGHFMKANADELECFACGKPKAKHYCHEWDCFIHARCALGWLQKTPEGKIVIQHGHIVVLDFKLEQEEKPRARR